MSKKTKSDKKESAFDFYARILKPIINYLFNVGLGLLILIVIVIMILVPKYNKGFVTRLGTFIISTYRSEE